MVIRRSVLLSTLYCPLNTLSRHSIILSGLHSVRNPKLPRFMPNKSSFFRGILRAVFRIVPSPPITIIKSTFDKSFSLL